MCCIYRAVSKLRRWYGFELKYLNRFLLRVPKVEGSEVKAQLLLALAWFHGIVQERRIFMPQGWTKEYDFSVGDLR